jgi:hypothetical protein
VSSPHRLLALLALHLRAQGADCNVVLRSLVSLCLALDPLLDLTRHTYDKPNIVLHPLYPSNDVATQLCDAVMHAGAVQYGTYFPMKIPWVGIARK